MTIPPSPNPLPTTEEVTQTAGPGWTIGLCIGECRDQAKDQAFQEAGFAAFMRATADHLERLRAIDKPEGVTQEWQDIATAPRDGTAVLCFDGEYDRIFVGSYMRITSTGKMEWAANVHSFVVFKPSHWQPLPPPLGQ